MKNAEAVIRLNDENIRLRLDFLALLKFEEATGKNSLSSDVWNNLTASDFVALLWAMAQRYHPSLTIDYIANNLSFEQIQEISETLQKIMTAALPQNIEPDDSPFPKISD